MQNPYLSLPRITAALRSLNLRPSRAMGQNFLIDPGTLTTIVDAAQLTKSDKVIEVGPGLGVLTWELLQHAGHVTTVELDKRLAARLRDEFANNTHLNIVQQDILATDITALVDTAPYKVVANLPYAITSPVLRYFLEATIRPQLIVVLVQWEVAQRICAKPGDMSVLAHAIQIYAEPEIIARIPAAHFYPAPAVDSAVLRLRPYANPPAGIEDPERLMRVIKAGFLHARKTLSNALPAGLAAMGYTLPRERVLEALKDASVDPQRRAETLSLNEWASIEGSIKDEG